MPRETSNPKRIQGNAWCFTMFRTDAPVFNKETMSYMIYQREKCPDTGKEHWQGYVYFRKNKTMGAVKTALNDNTVHLEKAKGNPEQNKAYCSKTESRLPGTEPTEHGVIPVKGRRTDLIDVAHAVKDGMDDRTLCEEFPEVMIKHAKGVQIYRQIMQAKGPRRKKTFVIFISGPAGCGKSRVVNELYPDAYPKDGRNKWWDGYYAQDVVNVDDFYGIDAKGYGIPLAKMLNIMDRYPCLIEPKGKPAIDFNSDLMFITSNKTPEEMYDHLTYEWLPSFRRRIDVEYRYVGDDYDVAYFEQRGWHKRSFTDMGKPLSWEPVECSLRTDICLKVATQNATRPGNELPRPADVDVQCTLEAIDVEDSDEAVVPESPVPNAAELMAIETIDVE